MTEVTKPCDEECQKCGRSQVGTQFVPDPGAGLGHIRHTCYCGHYWNSKPLDQRKFENAQRRYSKEFKGD